MPSHSSAHPGCNSIEQMLESYMRHLRAANYSPKTLSTYSGSTNSFVSFLKESSMPLAVAETVVIQSGLNVRNVDIAEVRSQLIKQGAILHRQKGSPEGLEQAQA